MKFSRNELAAIFNQLNIRYLAVYSCDSCDRKKNCEDCRALFVISRKEIIRL